MSEQIPLNTDVTIEAKDGILNANKNLLLTNSYFASMFKNDMIESHRNIIKFHHLSSSALTIIINFICQGQENVVSIKDDSQLLLEVIENSHLMQVFNLLGICWIVLVENYLQNIDNFWTLWDASEIYDQTVHVCEFMWSHFEKFKSKVVFEFSEINLLKFINHVKIHPTTELFVETILDWAMQNELDNVNKIIELINNIDVTSLSVSFLRDRLKHHPLVVKSEILEAIFNDDVISRTTNISKDKIKMCIYTLDKHKCINAYKFRLNCKRENNWIERRVTCPSSNRYYPLVRVESFEKQNYTCFSMSYNPVYVGSLLIGVINFEKTTRDFVIIHTLPRQLLEKKWDPFAILRNSIYFICKTDPTLIIYDIEHGIWKRSSPKPNPQLCEKCYIHTYCFSSVCSKLYFLSNSDELLCFDIDINKWSMRKIASLEHVTPKLINCDLQFIIGLDNEGVLWIYYINCNKWTRFMEFSVDKKCNPVFCLYYDNK